MGKRLRAKNKKTKRNVEALNKKGQIAEKPHKIAVERSRKALLKKAWRMDQ